MLKPGFVADNLAVLSKFATPTSRCAAVVGFVDQGVALLQRGGGVRER